VILCGALPSSAQEKKKPRLVLQITVDQLRGDLSHRYFGEFGEGGFRYLHGSSSGVVYEDAFQRHANTETIVPVIFVAPGVAPQQVFREVFTVDVAPTLSAILGITYPSGSVGKPLAEVLQTATKVATNAKK
jgi:hypothetical protein